MVRTRLAATLWPLVLTGRNPAGGAALAKEHNLAVRKWDLDDPTPFAFQARAVISTVNDPDDRVLRAAVSAGIPYVDITRWTSRLTRAVTQATLLNSTAPVLLTSGWMGGVVNLVVASQSCFSNMARADPTILFMFWRFNSLRTAANQQGFRQ